jgi:MbtH protein
VNPFDDEDGEFVVLMNDERQYSLWPTFRDAPAGWQIVHEKARRADCLRWIEENWTDMRPKSLADAMDRGAANDSPPQDDRSSIRTSD